MKVIDYIIVIMTALILMVAMMQNAKAQTYTGQFLRAIDGDTVTLLVEVFPYPKTFMKVTVRLFGIDTPEIRGECDEEKIMAIKARKFVEDALEKADSVQIKVIGKGKFGRIIAMVYYDETDLGSALIENGHARIYKKKRLPWCGQDV